MNDEYYFVNSMSQLYSLLQDELSRNLFWDRLKYDIEPSIDHAFQMVRTATEDKVGYPVAWNQVFDSQSSTGKKIILYGTGVQSKVIANLILKNEKEFAGFCGKDFLKYPTGIMGKPVFPPQYVLEHTDDYYIIISTIIYYTEIYGYLIEHAFPPSHVLLFSSQVNEIPALYKRQYFDFPELYQKGTAFVDAGCFDCANSVQFSDWCEGTYSEILAFEPDLKNYNHCRQVAADKKLKNFRLFNAGLGKASGQVMFESEGGSSSHIIQRTDKMFQSENVLEMIQIVALDEIIGDAKVGFIKMDIEGAEYDALLGSEHILLRDKPLLAICVYHKRGDMLQIMEYLHQLVPEYRFWIRHYNISMNETVLYAAIPVRGVME